MSGGTCDCAAGAATSAGDQRSRSTSQRRALSLCRSSHSDAFLAVARASATQSGMPTPRSPLPVTNSPGVAASAPVDRLDARQMADLVLRRSRVRTGRRASSSGSPVMPSSGRSADERDRHQLVVGLRRARARVAGAADKRAHQHAIRPARGAATSTTATTPPGCRCLRRAARRTPIRSADGRPLIAETRARSSPWTRTGPPRTAARVRRPARARDRRRRTPAS